MTLEEAIHLLETEYERAKHLDFVINPIAYALYKVWKKADRKWTNHKNLGGDANVQSR